MVAAVDTMGQEQQYQEVVLLLTKQEEIMAPVDQEVAMVGLAAAVL
jgi:hypothetical protein